MCSYEINYIFTLLLLLFFYVTLSLPRRVSKNNHIGRDPQSPPPLSCCGPSDSLVSRS